ncbi:MAG TPA: tetratricopeptide repeat protein, partial [bacterium]|nr:tetratricopeptide repeat protein [bacterium]
AEEERALAVARRLDPETAASAPANDENAADYDAQAMKAAADAAQLEIDARAHLENAAQQNDKLWQAQNELGILAMARADRANGEMRTDDAEKELKTAEERFKKAKAATDAKDIVDGNLVAVYSAEADVLHGKGKYGEALDLVRQAMELVNDTKTLGPSDAEPAPLSGPASFEVAFTGYQSARGEKILITAEMESALTRKYLEIDRDRKRAAAHPAVAEAESEIPARWRAQGERLVKRHHWRAAVAFYTALYDLYVADGAAGAGSVPADFKESVRKNLEKAFGERAVKLLADGEDAEALKLYALALNYIPNSRVLTQSRILEAKRRADNALASARWEDVVREIEPIYTTVYKPYDGKDPEKTKTREELATRLGAAYQGLTEAALARNDLARATKWADAGMALNPPRREWKENKGRVLIAMARESESAGDLEGALHLFRQARDVGGVETRVRATFAADTVQARLFLPRARREIQSATRSYGWLVVLGLFVTGVGIPAGRASLSAAARRRKARVLRAQAEAAYAEKRWNEAVDLFNDFLANTVGAADPETYEFLARSYRKIGDYDNALRFFERAANRMPGRRFNLERAEIYLVRRNLSLAMQALRTSATLSSDAEKLINFLNFLREKEGENAFVSEALAAVQMTSGDLDSARQIYLRLLDQNPQNGKVLRQLAELARKAGEAKERRRYLQKLVEIESGDAISLRELGGLLASEGDLPGAIESYKRAMEVMPGEGLAARIAELQAEMLVREAEAEIERLSREVDTPARRFRIGELHWRLGRVSEAKKFFEEAATLREYQVRALRYLGLIALSEAHYEDAISLLRGYLAKRTNLSPDGAEKEARYALAEAHEAMGDEAQAMAQFEAIFEADAGYKDVARRVKVQLAGKRSAAKGPVDCPFCHKKIPADAEYCPHCNFHLAGGGAGKYEVGEPTPTSVPPPDVPPKKPRS